MFHANEVHAKVDAIETLDQHTKETLKGQVDDFLRNLLEEAEMDPEKILSSRKSAKFKSEVREARN